MKKATLMKSAHRLAHEIVGDYGDYQIALSFALKEVWRQVKLYDKKRFGNVAIITAAQRLTTYKFKKHTDIFGVPEWIICKNLSQEEAYAVLNECNFMLVNRETEKAELVAFDTDFGTITMWTPKSVLVAA